MGGPQGALVDGGGGRGGREQSTGWAGSMAVPPPGQGTMGPMCVVAEQAAPSGTHHAPLLGTLGVARDGLGHLVACQQVVHKGEVAGREVGLRVGGWGRRMTGWREQDQAQSWLLAALNSGADLALPVVSRPPCPARPPRTLKIELVTAHAGVLAICGGVGEWRNQRLALSMVVRLPMGIYFPTQLDERSLCSQKSRSACSASSGLEDSEMQYLLPTSRTDTSLVRAPTSSMLMPEGHTVKAQNLGGGRGEGVGTLGAHDTDRVGGPTYSLRILARRARDLLAERPLVVVDVPEAVA